MGDIGDRLNQAVIDGARDMFQLILGEAIKVEEIKKGRTEICHFDINIIIGFAGNESGVFILQFPRKLSIEAANKMLGTDVKEDSEEMRDAVAEFMNMIVGKTKSMYSADEETFKVSIPTTIVGRNFVVHTKSLEYGEESAIHFSWKGYDFVINVFLK